MPELDPTEIEDLILGNGQPAGEAGFNLARVVAILSGLDEVPGVTVNRYCSSSLQTIRMAAHAIRAGEGDVFVAAGVETVSRFVNGNADGVPGTHNELFAEAEARSAERAEGGPGAMDAPGRPSRHLHRDGPDGRERRRARERQPPRDGRVRRAVAEPGGRERRERVLRAGDHAGDAARTGRWSRRTTARVPDTTVEKLAQLKPVFRPDGRVTAGNACPLNDGAAAVVVMSDRRASELGLRPLARIVSSGVSALDPEIMGLGPVEASRQALRRAGMSIDDVDLVEINEAFAAQVLPSARSLGIPIEKLNVHGGAIALGHPFGMTGARIMATLLNGLEAEDKTVGLETMCVGGGQGMAMIVERV